MIRIETPRLILREHTPEDLKPLHAMLSDPRLTYYLPSMRREDVRDTEAYLRSRVADAGTSPRLRHNLAVIEKSGMLVGSVGLRLIDGTPDDAHCGLGYFIRPDRWNLGYAAEAVRAALDWTFDRGAFRVSASCLAENLASRRVLEKCGFAQEGLLRRHTYHDGAWRDCAVYGLLKQDCDRRIHTCSEK